MNTASEFILELEEYWGGKGLSDKARQIVVDELQGQFEPSQWEPLMRAVIRKAGRFMPKLGEILEIAGESSIKPRQPVRGMGASNWDQTDCPMCAGEGLIRVVFCFEYERGDKLTKHVHFVDLGPYSAARWIGRKLADGENLYIFRCCCGAEMDTMRPKSWPKWNPTKHRRASQSELIENKPEEGKSEFKFKKAGEELPF